MSDVQTQPLVAVVIPFFQRNSGLLAKCVGSILAQKGYDNYHVLVIDDESPIKATDELEEILKDTDKVTVIRQPNAGPGAARNNGLDNLPQDTRYVAFIDSDDWWKEDFLLSAVNAMEKGYDIFFCNSQRFGFDETRFDWQKSQNLNLDASQHTLLDETQQLYAYDGDFFNYALVRSNIISTSAMVYRLGAYPSLRFSTKLFNGQDRLFKLSVCQKTNKVAFSPRVLVEEEEGINIFDSAKWGTAKSLVLVSNYIKLSKCIIEELKLEGKSRELVQQKLTESRQSFIISLLHLMAHRVSFDWKLVRATFKADPHLWLDIVPTILGKLSGRSKAPASDM